MFSTKKNAQILQALLKQAVMEDTGSSEGNGNLKMYEWMDGKHKTKQEFLKGWGY